MASTTMNNTVAQPETKLDLSKAVVVLGLGKTGFSVVRFLKQHGADVVVMDSRDNPPGLQQLKQSYPGIKVILGEFSEMQLAPYTQFVISPGIARQTPVIEKQIAQNKLIIGDIEVFAQFVDKPVIAITGSNGKSTVTSLVEQMALASNIKAKAGGNLGEPALELLGKGYQLYILELSSFQLESTYSLAPVASVVLNISEDHMDRYASLDEYINAKARIYRNAQHIVLNEDDTLVADTATNLETPIHYYALRKPEDDNYGIIDKAGEHYLAKGSELLLNVRSLKLKGIHNWSNALAALALGECAGFSKEGMLTALKGFAGLPHRCQWVDSKSGIQFINDSKGTNVGATIAALNGMVEQVVLIAGGVGKGADFSELGEVIAAKTKGCVLIGEAAKEIEASIKANANERFPIIQAVSMDDAVAKAADIAVPGENVLLSPACASFDMFDNFVARGEAFIKAVEQWNG